MSVLELFSLKNKVAVVTGGYGHLGKSISEGLNEAGAMVIIAGRSEEKFSNNFHEKKNYCFIQTDISDTSSISQCFAAAKQKFGHIDILVNNAVYLNSGGKKPEDITDEEWLICANGVSGSVFRCIREIIPCMRENGGAIINVASMYGVVSPDFALYEGECSPFLNPVNYGAEKAGVIQMTKYFATYLIRDKIRVNCISPGTFPSPKVQENEEFISRLSRKNPACRIGKPEDLKGAVVFLASSASDYIVGQNIMIDGGWTIW
ncbi:MAG: SDR family oxidoreductase [Prevotellaceae bacterium]|jgi:gluconate 5-dehydrogenase|nr:SDR family oxidoreductase [Prevotellaceae bacterium]